MMFSTKTSAAWAIVLAASLLVLPGCADKGSGERDPESAPQAAPPAAPDSPEPPAPPERDPERAKEAAPATPPVPAKPEPAKPEPAKPEPAKPESAKPASAKPEPSKPEPAKPELAKPEPPPAAPPQAPTQPPAVAQPKTAMKQDVVILTGAALGGVRLEHKLHAERAGNTCVACHHPSMPQRPATAPQQACSDCHTKAATPPMKTTYQGAFHDQKAQSGACIDCHRTENAKGKAAPLKCMECHKKENRSLEPRSSRDHDPGQWAYVVAALGDGGSPLTRLPADPQHAVLTVREDGEGPALHQVLRHQPDERLIRIEGRALEHRINGV
jgi:hypothetical protein